MQCATDQSWRGQSSTFESKQSSQLYFIHMANLKIIPHSQKKILLNTALTSLPRICHSTNRNARLARIDEAEQTCLLTPVLRPHTLKHWILIFNVAANDYSELNYLTKNGWAATEVLPVTCQKIAELSTKVQQFRGRTVLVHPFHPSYTLFLSWALLSSELRRLESRISRGKPNTCSLDSKSNLQRGVATFSISCAMV